MRQFRYVSGKAAGQPFDSAAEFDEAFDSGSQAKRGIGRLIEDCDAAAAEGPGSIAYHSHIQAGGVYAYDLGAHWAYMWFEAGDTSRPVILGVFKKPMSKADQASLAARL